MSTVYLLWHTREDDPDMEDSKLIGVYSSTEEADSAISLVAEKPGFIDHPKGFLVDPYTLNRTNWSEGFVGSAAND